MNETTRLPLKLTALAVAGPITTIFLLSSIEWSAWNMAGGLALAVLLGLLVIQHFYLIWQQRAIHEEQAARRRRTQEQMQDAYDKMEHQVEHRTEALSDATRRLQKEIVEHQRADSLLQESERRFESLARMAPVGIFYTDAQGICFYVNQRWSEVTGLAAEAILGQPWTSCLRNEDQDFLGSEWQRAMHDSLPYQFEYRFQRLLSGPVWALCQTISVRDGHDQPMGSVGTITDITQGKRVEMELSLLAAAVDQTVDLIYLTNEDGIIQYANSAFATVTGYSSREIIGQPASILTSREYNAPQIDEMWQTVGNGRSWHGRIVHRKRDGTFFESEIHLSPMRDPACQVVHFVAVARDVTSQILMERQLRQSQKLEAIGTLAGGIAHDFNNLLTPVLGFTEIALEELAEDHPLHRNLQMVMDAGLRARDLVARILTFGRCREQAPEPVSLGPLLRESIRLMRATLPTTVKISTRIDPDCGPVFADPTQMHQVIMNLCTNASHAMRHQGGDLLVQLERRTQEDGDSPSHVVLTIQDSGCGMSSEVMERIFDPFYTTKEAGSGTGLGLSVVHGIVKSCGGKITVQSRLGEGSRFEVWFPEYQGQPQAVQPTTTGKPPKGSERVMFVDDEPLVMEMGRQMLDKLGYRVWATTDARAAMDHFQAHADNFDLIITDQTMPGMTGVELARRMLAIRPNLPIILTTGFSEVVDEGQALAMGIRKYLLKPITPLNLAVIIREVLQPVGVPT